MKPAASKRTGEGINKVVPYYRPDVRSMCDVRAGSESLYHFKRSYFILGQTHNPSDGCEEHNVVAKSVSVCQLISTGQFITQHCQLDVRSRKKGVLLC